MLKGAIISDIEDSSEILMLNKKRQQENLIENVTNVKNSRGEEFDYDKEIESAFVNFINFDKDRLIDSFNRLETYKNSKYNISTKVKSHPTVINSEKRESKELSEEETSDFEKYKLDTNYYNKSEFGEGNKTDKLLHLKLKEESINLKKYTDFENEINRLKVRGDKGNIYDIEADSQNEKKKEKARMKDSKKRMLVLSQCSRCLGGKLEDHSVISSSDNIYIAYPFTSGSIADFHIVISTKEHTNSLAAVDENIYEEIRNYMKSIVAFNLNNDYSTVFVEYSQEASRMSHMEIDCIPIKHKLLSDAKLYFKKAFADQDDEWTTNKKIVDTTPFKGNLTKIINEKFAYVNVDFNAQGGFLHPVENNSKFSQVFLREIFCPLLKRQSHEIKYPKKLGLKELIDKVDEYKKRFSYYDWTSYS